RHPAVTGALAITALAGTAMLAMFGYHNLTLSEKNREISQLNVGLEAALVKVQEQKKVAEDERRKADRQRDIAMDKEKEARGNFGLRGGGVTRCSVKSVPPTWKTCRC